MKVSSGDCVRLPQWAANGTWHDVQHGALSCLSRQSGAASVHFIITPITASYCLSRGVSLTGHYQPLRMIQWNTTATRKLPPSPMTCKLCPHGVTARSKIVGFALSTVNGGPRQ